MIPSESWLSEISLSKTLTTRMMLMTFSDLIITRIKTLMKHHPSLPFNPGERAQEIIAANIEHLVVVQKLLEHSPDAFEELNTGSANQRRLSTGSANQRRMTTGSANQRRLTTGSANQRRLTTGSANQRRLTTGSANQRRLTLDQPSQARCLTYSHKRATPSHFQQDVTFSTCTRDMAGIKLVF
ncbi:hypothetical protein ElyMa_005669700 [Elysia marginata]|uniref:Uncharacterized protein n=1 Tax=Elysia marginata TaxID=1093978 RepID=A0AAV4FCS2_9GAST|nr:hypothetical protein ElyMa_005669700 [Elysia marginata]